MTRLKPEQINTLDEFTSHVDSAAKIAARIKELEAQRDQRIHEIQAPANAELSELQSELDKHLALAQPYAERHRPVLLGKRKSASTLLAIYGFRQQTSLKIEDADKLIDELDRLGRRSLLTVKTSLDKPAIRKAIADGETFDGAALVSTDIFFVEPKTDRAELAGE